MFPSLALTPLFTKLALWWLDEMFLAHRTAAIVSLNTLNQLHPLALIEESDRKLVDSVRSSLQHEIWAIEAILGISPDD